MQRLCTVRPVAHSQCLYRQVLPLVYARGMSSTRPRSALSSPFDFRGFLRDHPEKLQPPVNNFCVYNTKDGGNFTVMVVGGPNARNDYHVNETDEFFYQHKGAMLLKVIDDGKFRDIKIGEGEMFMLPANTPHNPCRFEDTIGVVVEARRPEVSKDSLRWYCPSDVHKEPHLIREVSFHCTDLGSQLKPVIEEWQRDASLRKCAECGTVAPPK